MTDTLSERPWFSPVLNKIADVAGDRAALLLGREKACQIIYIPKSYNPDHWLTKLIGEEPARKLVHRYGGNEIEIPPALAGQMRRRRLAIAELTEKGYSINKTTRMLGVARSTVKNHRRRMRIEDDCDDEQGSLF
ncbi:response regulator transcription factor [Ochrobactrum sp. MR28]|nr:response regulator transcription factor [Ochrobactrum sp. MR28]MBX8817998.1 response regulator transcription factor [Ochrobactrum sp. MR31]